MSKFYFNLKALQLDSSVLSLGCFILTQKLQMVELSTPRGNLLRLLPQSHNVHSAYVSYELDHCDWDCCQLHFRNENQSIR